MRLFTWLFVKAPIFQHIAFITSDRIFQYKWDVAQTQAWMIHPQRISMQRNEWIEESLVDRHRGTNMPCEFGCCILISSIRILWFWMAYLDGVLGWCTQSFWMTTTGLALVSMAPPALPCLLAKWPLTDLLSDFTNERPTKGRLLQKNGKMREFFEVGDPEWI